MAINLAATVRYSNFRTSQPQIESPAAPVRPMGKAHGTRWKNARCRIGWNRLCSLNSSSDPFGEVKRKIFAVPIVWFSWAGFPLGMNTTEVRSSVRGLVGYCTRTLRNVISLGEAGASSHEGSAFNASHWWLAV